MTEELNSKSFELLYETFLANKHLLSRVIERRMNSYFKDVAKVIDLYKTYIEFLENENAYINMEKKDGEKERTKREAKKARGKSKE
tara:strand:+ start:167 stop:424 length:258 start_codon:yes stop_codon:yes gene_type:complete